VSYSDELSVKLTTKDEMSARLKGVKKELESTTRAMAVARKEFQDTGSPEALSELKRLEKQHQELAKAYRESSAAARKARKDYEDAANGATKASTMTGRLAQSVEKHSKSIQRAGLVMAGAMALFSKGALQQFSRVEDASSALAATFDDQGDAMIAWAKKSGDALNLSQADALDALMTFSGYAKTAGLQGQELAKFSEDLVARSADLASYYGGTTADAINAIGSALRGEAEPARRYQIFVDDAALKAEYFAQTGEKVNGTLTAQQKVLAASALVMKQSSVAQGDLARTADSTANTLKDASQQWADFQAAMGETVAKGVTPFLRGGNQVLGMLTVLPQPVQQAAFAITALGVAAMIATPRLLAMNVALKGIGLSVAALGPIAAILAGGTAAILQAKDASAQLDSGEKNVTQTMQEQTGVLGFFTLGWNNAGKVIRKFTGEAEEAAEATKEVAQVSDYAASRSRSLAAAQREAASAASLQASAEKRLTGALGRAERMLARRDAMRGYREAMKAFIAKPSAEAGDAVSRSMLGVAQTYKDPEKRAKFVKRSYKDIEAAVKGSNLPSNIKTKITKPLTDAYIEARKLLSTMQAIAVQNANPATRNPGAQVVLNRAVGGAVFGPGSGTSDSIPAMLSNGEYVIRAAAARSIGYDTLDRLNVADRAPVLPPLVNAPVISLPASQPGRDVPLVGHLEVHASQQVDVDLALMRLHRQQQRDQRTRMAGTR
jgi:hypothetical protein